MDGASAAVTEPVGGVLGKPVFWLAGLSRWPKVWRGGGWILHDGRAHKRSRVQPARSEASEVWSRLPDGFKDVAILSFGQGNGTSIVCPSKIKIMAKTKASKKESARIEKIRDDFRKECEALYEAEIRQKLVRIGRKLPVTGKFMILDNVRAKCLPAMREKGIKFSEEILATQAGLDEVAIEYLVLRLGDRNLVDSSQTASAYRYKVLGKIALKYPALREQATLMQNKVVTDLAGTGRKDG